MILNLTGRSAPISLRIGKQSNSFGVNYAQHFPSRQRRLGVLSNIFPSDKSFAEEVTNLDLSPILIPKKRTANRKNILLLILFLVTIMFSIPQEYNMMLQPSFGSDKGMGCVTEKCGDRLTKCLSDSKCARGLGCFISCAARDSINSNDSEGACQVRCMDLHENSLLNEFTDCSLTKNKCYDPLKADIRYPPIPQTLSDTRLQVDKHITEKELKQLFRGKWYISAGLNPVFDVFDCQVHEFYNPQNADSPRDEKNEKVVADAIFSYRVRLDDEKYFTKFGQKRLLLVDDMPHSSRIEPMFDSAKKWGVNAFRSMKKDNIMDPGKDYRLVLRLRPNAMAYSDDWSILSYSNDLKYGYIVLAYRGQNSAWDGYGGLNIYTRSPINFRELLETPNAEEWIMVPEIEIGLRKIGLSFHDLTIINNSCD